MIRNLPPEVNEQQARFSGTQWTIALIALWAILSAMAEFEATSDLAGALTIAIAIGATGRWGLPALEELRTLTEG
jgi:hypothetical protein